jgi:hypothetical protein
MKGLPAGENTIRGVIQNFFNRPGVQVANCSPENFVQAIMTAVGTAKKQL